jgi:hypothetical protein
MTQNTNTLIRRYFIISLTLFFSSEVVYADDWPQWRGPNRDGVSSEKGLLQSWGEGGPALAQTISDIGKGCSSPIIARGKLFITGHLDQGVIQFSLHTPTQRLDLTGIWQREHI